MEGETSQSEKGLEERQRKRKARAFVEKEDWS